MNKFTKSFRDRLKKLLHRHKYTTLVLYSPSNFPWKKTKTWDVALRCDCGYTKFLHCKDITEVIAYTLNDVESLDSQMDRKENKSE